MFRHSRHRRTLVVAALGLSLLFVVRPAVAFDGSQDIVLGDSVRATLAGASGEVHRFPFFVTAGSVFGARVRPRTGADLAPVLRLVRPGGTEIDVGRALRSRGRIRAYRFVTSGYYELEVSSASGAGEYTLSTAVRRRSVLHGFVPGPGSEGTYRFHAYQSAGLVARARPVHRGPRGARPMLTGLTGPDGAAIDVTPFQRGSRSILRVRSLPEDGLYSVSWENRGAGSLRFQFRFRHRFRVRRTYILGAAEGIAARSIEDGDPELAARDGYVGSKACGRCHGDLVLSWSRTAHNSAVRAWDRPGLTGEALANEDDFRDGLDLSGEPAFAGFGDDAPLLSYDGGEVPPAAVTIGSVTYPVHRTMGGNGIWMQRFLTRVGRSYYVLPVQYNEADSSYAGYAVDDWYNGTTARYTSVGQIPAGISFEAQCSGCHNVGEQIAFDDGEFVTGYVELNVGCEQCHGPGAAHAASGNPGLITNPESLLDGTADGVAAANDVCGRCHDHGTGADPYPGTSVAGHFGYNAEDGVSQAFDGAAGFLDRTSDPDDFWGYKENPAFFLPGPTAVASRAHQQHAVDIESGVHGARVGYAPTCFECHDPHGSRQEHLLRATIGRAPGVATRLADNSHCLACHAGHGDFAAVSKDDVGRIASGARPVPVVRAVVDHMKNAAMPVLDGRYDPQGSGVGRCDTCHMPHTAVAATEGTDAAGFTVGDVTSHRFQAFYPRASELYGVTNSCNACHPLQEGDPTQTIIDQWLGDPDWDGTFHADTPRNFQNVRANPDRNGGVPCAQCHTTEGFVRIQVMGETPDQDELDRIVKDSLALDHGITCRACHGATPAGTFVNGPNPLRFPPAELCGRCHNAETVIFADFSQHGEIVRHPQKEMIEGTAGVEIDGLGPYTNGVHSSPVLFPNNCVDCHFDRDAETESHEFEPQVETCQRCHIQLATFDRPAYGDFDGDGEVEGFQGEVTGLLDLLEEALLDDELVTRAENGLFLYSGDAAMEFASDAQKRAVFNHYSVDFDGSRGIHNPFRAVQLLQRSYRDLTGEDVPGAALR